jgi:hypothetical protein
MTNRVGLFLLPNPNATISNLPSFCRGRHAETDGRLGDQHRDLAADHRLESEAAVGRRWRLGRGHSLRRNGGGGHRRLRDGGHRYRSRRQHSELRSRPSRTSRGLRVSCGPRNDRGCEGGHSRLLRRGATLLVLERVLHRRTARSDGSATLSGGLRRHHCRRTGQRRSASDDLRSCHQPADGAREFPGTPARQRVGMGGTCRTRAGSRSSRVLSVRGVERSEVGFPHARLRCRCGSRPEGRKPDHRCRGSEPPAIRRARREGADVSRVERSAGCANEQRELLPGGRVSHARVGRFDSPVHDAWRDAWPRWHRSRQFRQNGDNRAMRRGRRPDGQR